MQKKTALTGLLTLALLIFNAGVQAQTYSTIYRFTGANGDGAIPYGITGDAAGNLYGFTAIGGAGFGTIYKLNPAGNETVLHAFDGQTGGSGPQGAPVFDAAGNLYGVTEAGGGLFEGVIFKLDPAGNFSVLYNLPGQSRAGLTVDAAGNLYGTLFVDSTNFGSVYKFDTAGNFTTLHSFGSSPTDGVNPTARVTLDSAGNIYGTTENGGSGQHGTVFKIDTAGNYSILHNFSGPDGESMEGGVTLDGAGNIYGTTFDGGANGVGTIFKIDAAGNFTSLHSMDCGVGCQPLGELVRDASGILYGVTISGGSFGLGSVFKSDALGNVTQLYAFTNAVTDGNRPGASLFQDSAGVLYGTTLSGGSASNDGTVYKLVTAVPFSNLSAKLDISSAGFDLNGSFTLGAGRTINPTTQPLTLRVGTYTVTVPAGSFRAGAKGTFTFVGTINGVALQIRIAPLGGNSYSIQVDASGVNLTGLTNPVTVTLTIGNNTGTTSVTADFE